MRAVSKLTLALLLSLAALPLKAQDRAAMIQYFIELEEVELRATEIIEAMRDEMIADNRKLTIANFGDTYGSIFEDYRDAYIDATEQAYAVYSDQQISELYEFYRSDFGQWYRLQQTEFGPRIEELMQPARQTLRRAIVEARKNKRRKK